MKITVVGSGFVGQTSAMRLLEKGLGEVVLIDIIEGKPQGLALDLQEAAPVEGYEPTIVGTNDYADTAGSDVVVITAGFPRQPGMSRMDLLGKNAAIMRDVVGNVVPGSPDAILIVVSNPLDEMTALAARASGFPHERVFGMAGVLDSARLRYFIAEELGRSTTGVEAMTLGSHGDAMVALPRQATVDGTPLPELVDETTLQRLFQRTRDGGAEIVGAAEERLGLLRAQRVGGGDGRGDRAGHEGGPAGLRLGDRRSTGSTDVYVGVPARLGRGGVEEIVDAGPERGGARAAPRGRRGHPREVRGSRRALGRLLGRRIVGRGRFPTAHRPRERRDPAAEPEHAADQDQDGADAELVEGSDDVPELLRGEGRVRPRPDRDRGPGTRRRRRARSTPAPMTSAAHDGRRSVRAGRSASPAFRRASRRRMRARSSRRADPRPGCRCGCSRCGFRRSPRSSRDPTPTSRAPMTASRNPTSRSGLGRDASTGGADIGRSVASRSGATKDLRIPARGIGWRHGRDVPRPCARVLHELVLLGSAGAAAQRGLRAQPRALPRQRRMLREPRPARLLTRRRRGPRSGPGSRPA